MKIVDSFLALAVVCSLVAQVAEAREASARTLRIRCMTEPVSVDHLSCGGMHGALHARHEAATVRTVRHLPSRRSELREVRSVPHKPSLKRRAQGGLVAASLAIRSRQTRPASAVTTSDNRHRTVAPNDRLEAAYQPRQPRVLRVHQASAFCGRSANRATWECQRYFLLAPYESKNR